MCFTTQQISDPEHPCLLCELRSQKAAFFYHGVFRKSLRGILSASDLVAGPTHLVTAMCSKAHSLLYGLMSGC